MGEESSAEGRRHGGGGVFFQNMKDRTGTERENIRKLGLKLHFILQDAMIRPLKAASHYGLGDHLGQNTIWFCFLIR